MQNYPYQMLSAHYAPNGADQTVESCEVYKYFTPSGVKRLALSLVLSVWFAPRRIFGRLSSSVPAHFRNRRKHIAHLRQDCVFELRRVADEGVERGHSLNWSVKIIEEFV